MNTVFDNLFKDLAERNLKVLLIGGHALQAYGVVRQTLDIDWLSMDGDVMEIKDMMQENGYRLLAETENFLRFHHDETTMMDIDVLLVDCETFKNLYEAGDSEEIGSEKWRIPCPAHLVALKLHAMKNNPGREARDIADIVELFRATENRISDEDLHRLCLQYGPDGIYRKIRGSLK